MKNFLHIVIVIIVGSLIGTFINKLFAIWFPQGQIHNLINTAVNTGLNPTTLDLNIIEFTIGCIFKFNVSSIIGIFFTALIYKQLLK